MSVHPYRVACPPVVRRPSLWRRALCALGVHRMVVMHVGRFAITLAHLHPRAGEHRRCADCEHWDCLAEPECPACREEIERQDEAAVSGGGEGAMAVRVVKKEPAPQVVKQAICGQCGVTLEYVPRDVKTRQVSCCGDLDTERYIDCPECSHKVTVR